MAIDILFDADRYDSDRKRSILSPLRPVPGREKYFNWSGECNIE